jgi:D-sedoheptulose 7-phosphate isomerase
MKAAIEEHLRTARALLDAIPELERIADALIACFERGRRLYLLGNGGSAADAQHIAAELVGRFKLDRPALPAVALTTDTSNLTAIANDLGADLMFARQIEALVQPGDLAWALSVSGASPNVIAAVEAARARGADVIGFTSRRGDALAKLCTYCLRADHTDSDRVQETHVLAYHLVCERVERHFSQQEKGSGSICAQHPEGRSGKSNLTPFPRRQDTSR